MLVNALEKPDIIELEKGETLTIASTYETIKAKYELGKEFKTIKLKIYNNFFVIFFTDKKGKTVDKAFSDTWDFSII